jgi:hypothetical protein
MSLFRRTKSSRAFFAVTLLLALSLLISGCGASDMGDLPFVGQFFAEPEPPTPTPAPTATNTPEPTATPLPGETPIPATATPIPTPEVNVPSDFSPVVDDALAYSLAVPRGWTALDLRGSQFQNLANTFGMAGQLGPLNDFLDSEAGKQLGAIYITDITKALFGGLPTVLNVFVLDAPGMTPADTVAYVNGLLSGSALPVEANIENVSECLVNNLPAVCATATANLANVGFNAELFAKVTALIANDKMYILTLATTADDRGGKEPIFDQIIGTFRPE